MEAGLWEECVVVGAGLLLLRDPREEGPVRWAGSAGTAVAEGLLLRDPREGGPGRWAGSVGTAVAAGLLLREYFFLQWPAGAGPYGRVCPGNGAEIWALWPRPLAGTGPRGRHSPARDGASPWTLLWLFMRSADNTQSSRLFALCSKSVRQISRQ